MPALRLCDKQGELPQKCLYSGCPLAFSIWRKTESTLGKQCGNPCGNLVGLLGAI